MFTEIPENREELQAWLDNEMEKMCEERGYNKPSDMYLDEDMIPPRECYEYTCDCGVDADGMRELEKMQTMVTRIETDDFWVDFAFGQPQFVKYLADDVRAEWIENDWINEFTVMGITMTDRTVSGYNRGDVVDIGVK